MENKLPANPNSHVKPTKEQLKANIEKAAQELDQIPSDPQPQPQPSGDKPAEAVDPVKAQPTLPTPPPEATTPPENTPEPDTEQPKNEKTGLEKELAASFKESQVLIQRQKQMEDQIDEAQSMPEPTEDELKTQYADWETYDPAVQMLLKDSLHQKKINNRVKEIREAQKADQAKINAREAEVDVWSIKPDVLEQFPQLEGKQEDFKKFATKPSRLTLDLEDLVKLFLMELPKKEKHTGQMFETPSGGPNDNPQPKSDKLSIEESRTLRMQDFKKYKEYLRAGKIESVG